MTDKVSIAIKAMDRRPRGGKNYLGETLRNLARGGVFESAHFDGLTVVDGGSGSVTDFIESETGIELEEVTRFNDVARCFIGIGNDVPAIYVDAPDGEPRTLHQNAQRAIKLASAGTAEWSLVLEDDIDVCADFLESTVRWLREHASNRHLMYALGANYEQVEAAVAAGKTAWQYPVHAFYGAQALAWKREDAAQLAEWLGPDPFYPTIDEDTGKPKEVRNHGHDLLLQHWGRERGVEFFAASAPSFVDHIGEQSGIANRFFRFESWPGREWSYTGAPQMVAL